MPGGRNDENRGIVAEPDVIFLGGDLNVEGKLRK